MMNQREINKRVFKDTGIQLTYSEELRKSVLHSRINQKLYLEGEEISIPESKGLLCKTVISKKRTFEAAKTYAQEKKKVCVLNFASATRPGGGVVNGSSAQEECLCRVSSLYPCLADKKMIQSFYEPHKKNWSTFNNDDIIYTPDITVFKTDTDSPEMMDEDDWFTGDVITCAAPNLSRLMKPVDTSELVRIYEKRMDRIFRVAIANNVEVLILGAFGCGVFANDPRLIAESFRNVQKKYEGYFDTIEYAVYCRPGNTENYEVFQSVFSSEIK